MTNWLRPLIEKAEIQSAKPASWLDGSSPILIYGTGTFASDIYRVLLEKGLPVHGFVDHLDRSSPVPPGIAIYTPEKAASIKKFHKKAIVILGIHNYKTDVVKIIRRLNRSGFFTIISAVELYDSFGSALGTRYWLTSRNFYFSVAPILEETHALLEDKKSKALFQAIIEFRLTGDTTKLPAPDLRTPYHPSDIPAWESPLRFVDCGAFNGDTLVDFIKSDMRLDAVAAFEPDLSNYKKLSKFVSAHRKKFSDIVLFPCGVYSSTIQISFEAGHDMASNITKQGNAPIQCVALDDALPTFAPNLIKMDIEGAEYEALLGAREMISNYTPGLAISLYHRPEHLWHLPNIIEQISPGKYRFYIRSQGRNDFDLVLYALAKT